MLDSLVRSFMLPGYRVEPYLGEDEYCTPKYGPAVECLGHRRAEQKVHRRADGQEVVTRCAVWLEPSAALGPRDRLTLPDGEQPVLLSVGPGEFPGTGVVYLKALCG